MLPEQREYIKGRIKAALEERKKKTDAKVKREACSFKFNMYFLRGILNDLLDRPIMEPPEGVT